MAESVRCLPNGVTDPLGRPIIVIRFVPFDKDSLDYKPIVYRAFEQLRSHLYDQFSMLDDKSEPALQYVILLDLKELSMKTIVSLTDTITLPGPGPLNLFYRVLTSFRGL